MTQSGRADWSTTTSIIDHFACGSYELAYDPDGNSSQGKCEIHKQNGRSRNSVTPDPSDNLGKESGRAK